MLVFDGRRDDLYDLYGDVLVVERRGGGWMDPNVATWRRQKRAELLAARQATSSDARRLAVERIADKLDRLCAGLKIATVGLYWPIKSEIGLLPWGRALAQSQHLTLCLPVVVARRSPLEYWRWVPGDAMDVGAWNIPIPTRRVVVVPDLMLAPLVGFDRARYRLGYGGGYFDRTLAVLPKRPIVVGVGYALGSLETIFPQPHDIPMDVILTDQQIGDHPTEAV
jgi:5-formyltetrahydrofolate cyclo-ligase